MSPFFHLQEAGVSRAARVRYLQSFEAGTVQFGEAGANQFGIRFFGGNAAESGKYLFDTFPASRQSLALRPEYNSMTGIRQNVRFDRERRSFPDELRRRESVMKKAKFNDSS